MNKKTVLLALLCLMAFSGCARRYRITLTSGSIMDTHGKPKLDPTGQAYHFKNALGEEQVVPAFRIKEIAPR